MNGKQPQGMSEILINRARILAIAFLLFAVLVPSLVSAAPVRPIELAGRSGSTLATRACSVDATAAQTQSAADIGSRQNPVPPERSIAFKDGNSEYKVGISEVLRGNDAWKRLQGFDKLNAPPADGKEYLMVFVVVRYVSGSASSGNFCFNAVTRNQIVADLPSLHVRPSFKVEYTPDIPGGGWIVGEVYPDDPSPVLLIGLGSPAQNAFFFATVDEQTNSRQPVPQAPIL